MKEEKKLVQKFYVARPSWYSNSVDFSIVRGTVGKVEFMVKERDCIVGRNSDVRIALDHKGLLDNFEDAAKRFMEHNIEMREKIVEELAEVDAATKLVNELVESVKNGKQA